MHILYEKIDNFEGMCVSTMFTYSSLLFFLFKLLTTQSTCSNKSLSTMYSNPRYYRKKQHFTYLDRSRIKAISIPHKTLYILPNIVKKLHYLLYIWQGRWPNTDATLGTRVVCTLGELLLMPCFQLCVFCMLPERETNEHTQYKLAHT